MSDLYELVKSRVDQVLPGIVALRHVLHSEPELGMDTFATGDRIRAALSGTWIELREPLVGADVIGDLRGRGDRRICLRADVDANTMTESGDPPYKSIYPEAMHACGHDGHTAILTGAALVLDSLLDRLPVNVRFVFQPGEEMACGGRRMVELGACDGCEAAFALHGWPGLPVGAVSTRHGSIFAAGMQFVIRVVGRGCHGSMPEKGANPIPVASRLVEKLCELHARVNAADGSVVSVCVFDSGSFANIIPDTAVIQGTARFLDAGTGARIRESIEGIVAETLADTGCASETEFDGAYELPVVNSRGGYELVRKVAQRYLPGGFVEFEKPSMAMEDFAFYLKDRDGAMFVLGLGENSANLHTACFDFNDDALAHGITAFCMLALEYA